MYYSLGSLDVQTIAELEAYKFLDAGARLFARILWSRR